MSNDTLKAIDFFCGGGGMSFGMKRAKIDVLAGIDNDPACRETYVANHPDSVFIGEDIKTYAVERLGEACDVSKNDDNMLFIGCSPCQYWSVITGKQGSERKQSAHASRNLLHDFLHFVKWYRPGFVVIENVRGIERNPEESGLGDLIHFFDASGYKYKRGLLRANEFGVPQTRGRFILIASRVLDSVELPTSKQKKPTVGDVIGGENRLPRITAGTTHPEDKLHRAAGLSDINIERLKLTPEGGLRDHWINREDLQIDAYRDKSIQFFRENYGRLAWNEPAPTITTKFFSIGCGRFGHPEENRAISLREGAMLQTFPKSYKFITSDMASTARIIGNAVPPKFAESIGRSIMRQRAKAGR